ncbi:MAG: beta-ketoacyl-[acyl-carrier-protein] synthase family protein [Vicinamibacterales bacterium]
MFARRIVITGLGAVTPVGNSVDEFWDALLAGRSGAGPLQGFMVNGSRPGYAAEIKEFAPDRAGLPRKKLKMMGRQAQLAFAAVHEACADAQLTGDAPAVDCARLGILLGVGMLNADVMDLGRVFYATRRASDSATLDIAAFERAAATELFPLWLLRHIPNLAAAHASIALDAQGPSNTIATGCVAAANAIGEAARLIARGEADVVIAGGTDARVSPLAMLRYRDLGWLATRNDVPPSAVSAPFDRSAAGFLNGEAAAVVVLESLEHARARGARIRAELAAYAAANDAYDLLRPHPEGCGLKRAMTACLRQSGADAPDVVFSPATSVPAYDRAAAAALGSAFGGDGPPVTATRSVVGHTHAASAGVDCVAAVKALETGLVPATINLREPIADLDFVRCASRDTRLSSALVAAYSFGGHAAALLFRGWPS